MDDVAISRLQSSSGIMEVATVLRTSQCPTIVDVARTNGPWQSPWYRGFPVGRKISRRRPAILVAVPGVGEQLSAGRSCPARLEWVIGRGHRLPLSQKGDSGGF